MTNFPARKDFYLHNRRGEGEGTHEEWSQRYLELRNLADAECFGYFTERYGQALGQAAARFANLERLPPDVEAIELRTLVDAVEEAITNPAEAKIAHPIVAVVEATELRNDRNYIPPEFRPSQPVNWMRLEYDPELPDEMLNDTSMVRTSCSIVR